MTPDDSGPPAPNLELPGAVPVDHVAHGVYISGWRATEFGDYLRQAQITQVLKLFGNYPHRFPPDFNVFDHPVDDGNFLEPAQIERGVGYVFEQVRSGQRVLVACAMGISRSSTFVLAYLLERDFDLRDAFHLLRHKHAIANPHPALWLSLIHYYKLRYTWDDVRAWFKEDSAAHVAQKSLGG